tara:strand:+ start:6610 stop:7137 length:528 start_codon:yes stop_codon:yes gene_type:complete
MSTDDIRSPATESGPSALVSLVYLFTFMAIVFIAAAAGGAVTATDSGVWYASLVKPALTPAPWVFPIVWNSLYFLMAISAWLVWRAAGNFDRAGPALCLFGIQLSLNLSWSIVFFGLQSPILSLINILALDLAVAGTIFAFLKTSRLAGTLLVPYLGWALFATYLTAGVVVLNAS